MRSYRSRGGQVTIFIIVALMVLFIFSLFIMNLSKLNKYKLQNQIDTQLQVFINQNSIEQYVTGCMNVLSDEATIIATSQSGIFNYSDLSLLENYTSIYDPDFNRTFNISIASYKNIVCQWISKDAPGYPKENYSIVPGNILEQQYLDSPVSGCRYSMPGLLEYSGPYGFFGLQKLCNRYGLNRVDILNRAGADSDLYSSCSDFGYNKPPIKSTQQLMEEYINREIKKCVNFSQIIDPEFGNYTTIDVSNDPNISIGFGTSKFYVNLDYPFTITVKNRQPVVKVVNFRVQKDYRLKELYDCAGSMIQANSQYANMTLKYAAAKYCQDNGFDVTIEKNKNTTNKTFFANLPIDIVKIKDPKSIIQNSQMTYYFATINKPPALEYISRNNYSDIEGVVNDTLTISPQGYDPDDDEITYEYSGWGQNYKDSYNLNDPNCISFPLNMNYVVASCTSKNITKTVFDTLMNSTPFISTKQNASIVLLPDDVGFHIINITIRSRSDLIDYQLVRVWISPMPIARLHFDTIYQDIPSDKASFEDPFILNGTNSTITVMHAWSGDNFSYFYWFDNKSEINISKRIKDNTINMTALLPNDTIPPLLKWWIDVNLSANMRSIAILPFNASKINGLGTRKITLKANTTLGVNSTSSMIVNVTQCLPHRSNISSYPFNTNPYDLQDAFYANHTCCADTYTYKSSSSICFMYEAFGFHDALENTYEKFTELPNAPSIDGNSYSATPTQYNDIYKIILNATCSGDRGNICSGNFIRKYQTTEICNDNNYGTGGLRRCVGPVWNGTNFTVSNETMHCVNYSTGDTFEKFWYLFNEGSDPSIISSFSTCGASIRSNGVTADPNGKYSCGGVCDGKGNCTASVNCLCDRNNGANQFCNGIPYPGNSPLSGSNKICNLTNSYLFECNDCLYQNAKDSITGKFICGHGGLNCNGDTQCEDSPPMFRPPTLSTSQYCNSTCQIATCPSGGTFSNFLGICS